MTKTLRRLGAVFQQCVPMAISISSLSASASLAVSGLAFLWGSPGNPTTEAIGTVVHFVAYRLAGGNEGVADIWLLQAPIAVVTYLLITSVPLVIGCLAIEVWSLRHAVAQTNNAKTTT